MNVKIGSWTINKIKNFFYSSIYVWIVNFIFGMRFHFRFMKGNSNLIVITILTIWKRKFCQIKYKSYQSIESKRQKFNKHLILRFYWFLWFWLRLFVSMQHHWWSLFWQDWSNSSCSKLCDDEKYWRSIFCWLSIYLTTTSTPGVIWSYKGLLM